MVDGKYTPLDAIFVLKCKIIRPDWSIHQRFEVKIASNGVHPEIIMEFNRKDGGEISKQRRWM